MKNLTWASVLVTAWISTLVLVSSKWKGVYEAGLAASQKRVAQLEQQLELAEAKLRKEASCGEPDLDFLTFLQRSERSVALEKDTTTDLTTWSFFWGEKSIIERINRFIAGQGVEWGQLKKCYNGVEGVKTLATWKFGLVAGCGEVQQESCKKEPGKCLFISIDTMLTFVRGLSRLYVDYQIGQRFLEGDVVYSLAPGSSIITSDYDLELVGPGACRAAEAIFNTFQQNFGDLGKIADTNLYLGPSWIYMTPRFEPKTKSWEVSGGKPFNLEVFEIESKLLIPGPLNTLRPRSDTLLISVPREKVATDFELQGLKSKITGTLQASFPKVIEFAKRLESFYYQDIGPFAITKDPITTLQFYPTSDVKTVADYWLYVTAILQNSVESYVALSTVMVVVIGIQGKKLDAVAPRLDPVNFIIAALENMNDLLEHYKEESEAKLVDTSKYTFRFMKCVEYLPRIIPDLVSVGEGILLTDEEALSTVSKPPRFLGDMVFLLEKLVDLRGKKIEAGTCAAQKRAVILNLYQTCILGFAYHATEVLTKALQDGDHGTLPELVTKMVDALVYAGDRRTIGSDCKGLLSAFVSSEQKCPV